MSQFFKFATEDPIVYNHAGDTWNGIKHVDYSKAVKELLQAFKTAEFPRTKIDEKGAMKFVEFIKGSIKLDKLDSLASQLAIVRQWITGFELSIVNAKALKAANPLLSVAEVKAATKAVMEGTGVDGRTAVGKAVNAWRALSKSERLKYVTPFLKKAGPALTAIMLVFTINRAVRGQGTLAESGRTEGYYIHEKVTAQIAYEMMFAEEVETYVFPKVQQQANTIADTLGMPTLKEWPAVRRQGVTIFPNGNISDP